MDVLAQYMHIFAHTVHSYRKEVFYDHAITHMRMGYLLSLVPLKVSS